MFEEVVRNVGLGIFALMAICLGLAIFLFVFFVSRLRHLDIPQDAGFGETLLYVPLSLVLFIDLLDFALDILAAPITWVVLDRLGLKALRNVFALEAIIPFTQAIPAMTIAWVAVRLLGPGSVQSKAVGD
jgi:uncharacterized membrane-anchored protein